MHRRLALSLVVSALAAVSVSAPAFAAERGTKEEAIKMVNTAFDHIKKVGEAKAFDDFTKDKTHWVKKDLYVFVLDNSGAFLAHGANEKLLGRDMSNMKDANGKAIFPAMQEVVAKGSGWVDYDWAHPQSKKVEGKTSYLRKTPDGKALIGVGVYR
jgi:cytochrome c